MKFIGNIVLGASVLLIIGGLGSIAWHSNKGGPAAIGVETPKSTETSGESSQSSVVPANSTASGLIKRMHMTELKPAETAKNFSLQTIDGKTVTLSQYKGKTVLISFWTTW